MAWKILDRVSRGKRTACLSEDLRRGGSLELVKPGGKSPRTQWQYRSRGEEVMLDMNNVICETEVPILGFVGINCISHLHRKQPMEGSSFLNRTVVRVSLLLFNSTVLKAEWKMELGGALSVRLAFQWPCKPKGNIRFVTHWATYFKRARGRDFECFLPQRQHEWSWGWYTYPHLSSAQCMHALCIWSAT